MRVEAMIKVSRYRVLISLVLAAFLTACARPGGSAPPPPSRLEHITQAGVLRVGVAADVPPFAFFDRQGERQGFDIEIMQEIARRMGVELAWVDAAYEPLREAVVSGRVDVAVGAIPYSEEWDRNVDFTQPYYDLGQPGPADPGLLFIILPQGEAALAERLNGIIDELEGEGFLVAGVHGSPPTPSTGVIYSDPPYHSLIPSRSMPTPDTILELIERFERNHSAHRSEPYNETQVSIEE